jgi:hypothetical protein
MKLNFRDAPTEEIILSWHLADGLTLQGKKALYLYRRVKGKKILYIGKACSQTIYRRFACPSKSRLGKLFRHERGGLIKPLIANFHTSRALTPQLIDDVERLLIFLVQPEGNGPGKQSCQLYHRSLDVRCDGEWPHPRNRFWYKNDFPAVLAYGSE